MLATRDLTSEELALLPCYAKAFKCPDDDRFSSSLISCTPAYLKFPHDDVTQHVIPLTVWNKSNECLELDVENPKTNVFEVFYDQVLIYGGCHAIIYVQCTPHDRQVCFDTLKIRVSKKNRESDAISIPLQLFPCFSWFSLPKLIVLPHVMIGSTAEITITLPKVPSQERFFITARSPYTNAINISPSHGVLSPQCGEGIKDIVIRYTPKEYITIVHVVNIHFPGVDTAPHDLILFARTIPGLERDRIFRETQEILRWKPKPLRLKVPEPKLIFGQKSVAIDVYNILEDESVQKEEDLTKPAGVIHFLLRREEKIPERKKCIGPLGLTFAQERKMYEKKLKEFKDSLNKEHIRQKHITSQNFKAFLGQDTIDLQPDLLEKIKHEGDLHIQQYEQAVGLRDNDPEDLIRKKLELSTQRSLRRVTEKDFSISDMPQYTESEIAQTNEEYRKCIREISRRRFIQAAYIIITRYRVSKRIPKLQILKKEIRLAREGANRVAMLSEKAKLERNVNKMSLSGEVRDDHRHSLQDDELQRQLSIEVHELKHSLAILAIEEKKRILHLEEIAEKKRVLELEKMAEKKRILESGEPAEKKKSLPIDGSAAELEVLEDFHETDDHEPPAAIELESNGVTAEAQK